MSNEKHIFEFCQQFSVQVLVENVQNFRTRLKALTEKPKSRLKFFSKGVYIGLGRLQNGMLQHLFGRRVEGYKIL